MARNGKWISCILWAWEVYLTFPEGDVTSRVKDTQKHPKEFIFSLPLVHASRPWVLKTVQSKIHFDIPKLYVVVCLVTIQSASTLTIVVAKIILTQFGDFFASSTFIHFSKKTHLELWGVQFCTFFYYYRVISRFPYLHFYMFETFILLANRFNGPHSSLIEMFFLKAFALTRVWVEAKLFILFLNSSRMHFVPFIVIWYSLCTSKGKKSKQLIHLFSWPFCCADKKKLLSVCQAVWQIPSFANEVRSLWNLHLEFYSRA